MCANAGPYCLDQVLLMQTLRGATTANRGPEQSQRASADREQWVGAAVTHRHAREATFQRFRHLVNLSTP